MFKKRKFIKYLEDNSVKIKKEPKFAKKHPLSYKFDKLEDGASGQHSISYKVTIGEDCWIIKEGRSSIPLMNLMNMVSVNLPWVFLSPPLSVFDIKVLPKPSNALKGFAQYLEFARYLGYFTDKKTLERLKISKKHQKKIRKKAAKSIRKRDNFGKFVFEILGKDKKLYKKLKRIWKQKKYSRENFLPNEYLILSRSVKSKRKKTYYIVQDFVEGDILGEVDEKKFDKEIIAKLVVLITLVLYMTYNNSILLDTRPEKILAGMNEWFRKTGNIIINTKEDDVKVVDTRSVWHPKRKKLQRTLLIPSLIQNSVGKALRHYLKKFSEL